MKIILYDVKARPRKNPYIGYINVFPIFFRHRTLDPGKMYPVKNN